MAAYPVGVLEDALDRPRLGAHIAVAARVLGIASDPKNAARGAVDFHAQPTARLADRTRAAYDGGLFGEWLQSWRHGDSNRDVIPSVGGP